MGGDGTDAFIRDELSKGRYDPAIAGICFDMLMELFNRTLTGDLGPATNEVGEVEDHEQTPGDIKWTHAQARAAEFVEQAGLAGEGGVDRVIEASGAEDCGLIGIAIAKQGAICKFTYRV